MGESNQLKSIAKSIVSIVNALLAWLLILPILPLLSFFYIFKTCVIRVAKIVNPKLKPLTADELLPSIDKIAPNDHIKFDYERTPLHNISVFFKLREPKIQLDIKEIEHRFQEHIDKNVEFGWKLKSYLTRFGGYSFFHEVPKFNISNQIQKVNLSPKESVYGYLNSWIMQRYPLESPLWELLILEKGSESYIAFKLHHTIGDGISGTQILDNVLGLKQHPDIQKYVYSASRRYSASEKLFLFLSCPALAFELIGKAQLATDPFKIKTGQRVEQYMSTSTLNVTDVKSIAKMLGVSFNSVILTIYSGAIQRLLGHRRTTLPTNFMVPLAQPWSGRSTNFIGNQFVVITPHVPLNITDPLKLLHNIQERITYIYTSGLFPTYVVALNVMAVLPFWLQVHLMNFANTATTALSPMLAGDSTMYDGNVVESVHLLTGITTAHFGLKTMVFSVNTKLAWTVVGSRNVFRTYEDLDLFTKKYIPLAFDELRAAISNSGYLKATEQVKSQIDEIPNRKKLG